MKKEIQRKIKTYVGLAGVIITYSQQAESQVLYTDIAPDDTVGYIILPSGIISFGSRSLDINNDFSIDFSAFRSWINSGPCGGYGGTDNWSSSNLVIKPFQSNEVLKYGWSPTCLPWNDRANLVSLNTLIGNTPQFSPTKGMIRSKFNGCSGGTAYCYGGYPIGFENYVPLKLSLGGNNHFGWLRIKVINKMAMVLMDFAYETTAGVGILAGDTTGLTSGIHQINLDFKLYAENQSIHISNVEHYLHTELLIYDLTGRLITKIKMKSNSESIYINKRGVYFVEVRSLEKSIKRKVFVF
jgi:hypothetical protein